MSINSISSINTNRTVRFGHGAKQDSDKTPQEKAHQKKVKAGVFATTLLGVGTALAVISKKQGFSLNPSKIFGEKPSRWAIFNIKKGTRQLHLEGKEILGIAAGSVGGGLAGGAIFDDIKNFPSKVRESVNQMLGDVMIPLGFVIGGSSIYSKLAGSSGFKNNIAKSKFLVGTTQTLISAVSLGTGIIAGNKASNFINEKIHNIEVERKIKATDFAPHLDDVCLSFTLMAPKSILGSILSKFVPVALMVPGIETGTARAGQHKKALSKEVEEQKLNA